MTTAPPPSTRPPRQARREAPKAPSPRWRRWLLLGLFFGLSYGLTQRLLEVRWGDGATKAPAFKPKAPAGGDALGELRRREGAKPEPLAADLEQLSRKQREATEREAAAKREQAERQKAAAEEDKERLDSDRRRLEELGSTQSPASQAAQEPVPEAPSLPPPVLSPAEQPTSPESQPPSQAPATLP